MSARERDHGGGLDAAVARWGGWRAEWLDLSTGINPVPYPLPPLPPDAWTALPDQAAAAALEDAARAFWDVPAGAEVVAAPGLSSVIARLPRLLAPGAVHVPGPTYNEHAASFEAAGWRLADEPGGRLGVAPGATPGATPAAAGVFVHPNNPDGRTWGWADVRGRPLTVVDESFCDPTPELSHVARAGGPGVVVLKSFGKFWGLAGLRLGFAILAPGPLAGGLREALGPWPVSGPALAIGRAALADGAWAERARARLAGDAARLDAVMAGRGAKVAGGTALFRLYEVDDAGGWQERLARGQVLARAFPYAATWLRLGLPAPDRWAQLEAALGDVPGDAPGDAPGGGP